MKIMRISKDERGAVLPLVALFIFFVALGIVALVVDVGMMYSERRTMVAAADAGALAGAIEMQKWGSDKDTIESIAKEVARYNGAEGIIEATAFMGSGSINDMKVVVEVKNTINLYFAKTFNINTADVPARAVAKPMRFNPAIFPIGVDKTKAYVDGAPRSGLVYLHDSKEDPSYFSDLLDLDGNSGGASSINQIIVDRYYKLGPGFAAKLSSQSLIASAGGWKNLSTIELLLQKAYDYSSDVQLRQAYMTALAPVYTYVDNHNATILEFAEIVIVDHIVPKNKDKTEHEGVKTAFPYTLSGNSVIVDYTQQVGNNRNIYPKQNAKNGADVVVAYFTGTTVSISDVLNGNYQGTLYNQVKFNAVSLVE